MGLSQRSFLNHGIAPDICDAETLTFPSLAVAVMSDHPAVPRLCL